MSSRFHGDWNIQGKKQSHAFHTFSPLKVLKQPKNPQQTYLYKLTTQNIKWSVCICMTHRTFTESVNIFHNNIISTLYHFRLYNCFSPQMCGLQRVSLQKMTLVFIFPIQYNSIQTPEELCEWLWVCEWPSPSSGFWSSVIREYSHDYCRAASRHSFTPDCRHSTNTFNLVMMSSPPSQSDRCVTAALDTMLLRWFASISLQLVVLLMLVWSSYTDISL